MKRTLPPIADARGGFQLIELTCATFIITVGLFGIIQMYMHGLDKIRAVSEYETAQTVLVNELETLRAQPFSELTPGTGQPFLSNTPMIERLHEAATAVDIAPAPDGTPGLLQVTVRIGWVGEHGRHIEKSLTTLRADLEAHHE